MDCDLYYRLPRPFKYKSVPTKKYKAPRPKYKSVLIVYSHKKNQQRQILMYLYLTRIYSGPRNHPAVWIGGQRNHPPRPHIPPIHRSTDRPRGRAWPATRPWPQPAAAARSPSAGGCGCWSPAKAGSRFFLESDQCGCPNVFFPKKHVVFLLVSL